MENENRLIYVDEALRMISNSQIDNPFVINTNEGNIWHTAHSSAIDCVKNCPTVDAVEVVHGRWIEKPNPWGQDGSHSYDCSICGERTCVVGHKLRYCPNCGAKMDGDKL